VSGVRRLVLVAVLCTSSVLLSGCSAPVPSAPGEPQVKETPMDAQDLAEVKAQMQEWTAALVRTVPADLVDDVWQNDQGTLLSCRGDAWTWSGAAQVKMTEEQDLVPYLETMAESWSDDEGFSSSFEKTGLGHPRLELLAPGGASVTVDARGDRRRLVFTTFSVCVSDLADYHGHGSY